jgi:hypothetical protein
MWLTKTGATSPISTPSSSLGSPFTTFRLPPNSCVLAISFMPPATACGPIQTAFLSGLNAQTTVFLKPLFLPLLCECGGLPV